jgi:hypothetical protein
MGGISAIMPLWKNGGVSRHCPGWSPTGKGSTRGAVATRPEIATPTASPSASPTWRGPGSAARSTSSSRGSASCRIAFTGKTEVRTRKAAMESATSAEAPVPGGSPADAARQRRKRGSAAFSASCIAMVTEAITCGFAMPKESRSATRTQRTARLPDAASGSAARGAATCGVWEGGGTWVGTEPTVCARDAPVAPKASAAARPPATVVHAARRRLALAGMATLPWLAPKAVRCLPEARQCKA